MRRVSRQHFSGARTRGGAIINPVDVERGASYLAQGSRMVPRSLSAGSPALPVGIRAAGTWMYRRRVQKIAQRRRNLSFITFTPA